MLSEEDLLAICRDKGDAFAELSGFEGISVGLDQDGNCCLRIFLSRAAPEETQRTIRDSLKGVPLDVRETDGFVAF